MLRVVKATLILLVALWGLIGVLNNVSNVSGGFGAVQATMDPPESAALPDWRRVTSPLLVWIGFLIIPLGKLGAAALCGIGAWRMWCARNDSLESFGKAKELGLAGCGIAIAMLFGGFFAVGENFFNLWMTPMGEVALPNAFRMIGCVGLIAIFVGQNESASS